MNIFLKRHSFIVVIYVIGIIEGLKWKTNGVALIGNIVL